MHPYYLSKVKKLENHVATKNEGKNSKKSLKLKERGKYFNKI